MYTVPIVLMALSAVLAAPATFSDPEDYSVFVNSKDMQEQVIMPQKRAALVLDRLLVALQKALNEGGGPSRYDVERDGPRTAPLRIAGMEANDLKALNDVAGPTLYEPYSDGPGIAPLRFTGVEANDLTGLQRRGQGSTRGRVLRCYFNAVTCF